MNLEWKDITKEQLAHLFLEQGLSDAVIAQFFDVTKAEVTEKRKAFGLVSEKSGYELMAEKCPEQYKQINQTSKENLLKPDNFSQLSKVLTHYLFRNGPVEEMYAEGKLSDEEMKLINQFMVNRICGLLQIASEEKWLKLELLAQEYRFCGSDWDEAEPDIEEIEKIFEFRTTI